MFFNSPDMQPGRSYLADLLVSLVSIGTFRLSSTANACKGGIKVWDGSTGFDFLLILTIVLSLSACGVTPTQDPNPTPAQIPNPTPTQVPTTVPTQVGNHSPRTVRGPRLAILIEPGSTVVMDSSDSSDPDVDTLRKSNRLVVIEVGGDIEGEFSVGSNVTIVGSVALSGPESKGEYFLSGHFEEKNKAYLKGNIIKDQQGNDLKMTDSAITAINSPAIWPEGLEPLPVEEALYEVLRTPLPGNRNDHNLRAIKSVADDTGEIIDSEDEVGGYPDYMATSRPIEADSVETRQAWLDVLEDEIAVDQNVDLSRRYNLVGSAASDKLKLAQLEIE